MSISRGGCINFFIIYILEEFFDLVGMVGDFGMRCSLNIEFRYLVLFF